MALEKSELTNGKISYLMKDFYDIDVRKVSYINSGSANIYKIYSKNKVYILKEFQKKYTKDMIEQEVIINQHLIQKDFPTAIILPTKKGDHVLSYKGIVMHLQEYIEGEVLDPNSYPIFLMKDSAKYLAKIHEDLSDMNLLYYGMSKDKWSPKEIKRKIEQINNLVTQYIENTHINDDIKKQVIKDLKYKKEFLLQNKNNISLDKLTIKNSHGDYNTNQIIIQDQKIKAVIDFTGATALPVCWEIMRSYSYSDPECKNGTISVVNLINYIKEYLKIGNLEKYDLYNMTDFYIWQISTSLFGYKEYLENQEEELLNFAIWRTKHQKALIDNKNYIDNEIKKITNNC